MAFLDTIKKVPIVGNVIDCFDGDETTATATTAMTNEATDYGKDAGDNFFVQAGSAAAGAVGGFVLGNKLSGGNKLIAGAGALVGGIVMNRLGKEIATDIQRGNQYVDQQAELGNSEGNLLDRFKAVGSNFINFNGQSKQPQADVNVDVDV